MSRKTMSVALTVGLILAASAAGAQELSLDLGDWFFF